MKFWGWLFRIFVIALGMGLFVLQSQYAKKTILEFFLNQPFKNSSLRVEVEGVRGLFPFQFEVASLDLKDKDARIAGLNGITAFWSIPSLFAQQVKVGVAMKNQLGGEVIYRINKHALFVSLQGDGLVLWDHAALKSIVVDLPELTLVRGNVIAKLQDDHEPVTLSMQLEELDDDRLSVKNITLAGKGIQGKGQAIVYSKQDNWEGEFESSISDLALYQSWFLTGIGGSASVNCKKQMDGQLSINATLDRFHYGTFNTKSLHIQHIMKNKNSQDLTLQGQDAVINNIPLTNLVAKAQFEDNGCKFNVVAKGPRSISFDTQGTASFSSDETHPWEISFDRAQLIHPMHQLLLKKPTTISWSKDYVRVQQIWLAAGVGTLTVQDFAISNQVLSGNVLINQLPLTFLRIINPEWIASGHLTGKGSIKGTTTNPEAELSLQGKSLHWGSSEKSHRKSLTRTLPIDLSTEFKLANGLVLWQVKFLSGQVFQLASQGKVTVDGWSPTEDSSIDGVLKGQGDMGIISRFMQTGDLIQGRVTLDLITKGTIKNPQINGRISVANGVYENAAFGTLIRNIKIQGQAINDTITFSSITGQDNAKGHVTGYGTVKLTSLLTPEVNLQLKLDKLIVVQNDEISGKTSGFLNLQGSVFGGSEKAAKITGDLILQPLEIHLEDHAEKVVTIQLLEKKKNGTFETAKEHHQQAEVQKGSIAIPLDIKLSSPGEIYIRGYGLNSQWKGEMRTLGPLSDPYLVGLIALVRGKFDLLGKPLKLTEGLIRYTEAPKNDPFLTIVGTREISDITAIMRIEGRASDPKIIFSSTPALPQEEVLARLLFGRGVESMSVTQSLLLANALSTFRGKNNLNFTDKIRTAFGLDVLEFKERKTSDGDEYKSPTQMVSVGKQITDNVYLSLDQSVSGDSGTTATLQYDVTPSLKIEADVGGDVNAGVGFAWVKKY